MTKALILLLFTGLAPVAELQPVDFSGTWVMDEKRSGSATHEAFVGPVVWVIRQSPDELVVERRRGDTNSSFIYPIRAQTAPVGREVLAPTGDAPGHRAYWSGQRLIIETHQEIQGKTVTTREALEIVNGELLAERVLEVEHGYTIKGAQNFSAVKDFFIKRY